MGKFVKIILWLVAIFILASLILAIVLPLFIEPNDFKPEIEAAVKDSTGRKLIIDGDLHLSVFPWIGVTTGKMVLENAPGFSSAKFAEIEASEIKVKLLPLLSQQIEVNRVVLNGLRLNLATKANGATNWSDLSSTDTKSEQKKAAADNTRDTAEDKTPPMLAALVVGGIALEDAFIVWDDRKNDQHIELQNLNLKIDSLKFNQPVDVDLSVTIANDKPAVKEQLQISTTLILNEALSEFMLNDFKVDSTTAGEALPDSKINSQVTANIAIDLDAQTAKIPDLKLAINDLQVAADLTATDILDKFHISGPINIAEFNLRQWLRQMGVKVPAMQDASTMSSLSLQFDLASTDTAAKLDQLQIKLDDSTIQGHVEIKNFNTQAIAFKLNLDAINVDRYQSADKQSTNKSNSKSQAVVPPSAVAAATFLPIKTLQDLNASGQLSIGQLTINGLSMQGIDINLKARKGLIETSQKVKQFYQGRYSGKTRIDTQSSKPVLSLDEKMTNVQLGSLLKDLNGSDRISGTANASAKLNGRGNTLKAIKSSLNGSISVDIKDGYINGVNLKKTLDNAKSLLKTQSLASADDNEKTKFSEISASAKVNNGVLSNKDLFAKSSALRVNGKGKVNLVSEALDYKVKAKLVRREATATKSEKIQGLPLAINIGGTLSKPTYRVDLQAMLMEKNKAKIEAKIDEKKKKIIEKIDKKLGKELGDKAEKFLKKLF